LARPPFEDESDFEEPDFEPDDDLERDGVDRDSFRGVGFGEAFERWDDEPDGGDARLAAGRDDPWLRPEDRASVGRSLRVPLAEDARLDDGFCSVFLGSAIRRYSSLRLESVRSDPARRVSGGTVLRSRVGVPRRSRVVERGVGVDESGTVARGDRSVIPREVTGRPRPRSTSDGGPASARGRAAPTVRRRAASAAVSLATGRGLPGVGSSIRGVPAFATPPRPVSRTRAAPPRPRRTRSRSVSAKLFPGRASTRTTGERALSSRATRSPGAGSSASSRGGIRGGRVTTAVFRMSSATSSTP
jgi:hypothetical protein